MAIQWICLRRSTARSTISLLFMAERTVTGIDVGTYQAKVVIARQPKKAGPRALPQIIGTGFAESRGMRHGFIINKSTVVKSVRAAVAQAEKAAGLAVKHQYISIGART